MDNMSGIFILTHKDFVKNKRVENLRVVKMGPQSENLSIEGVTDNVGENISNKNQNYSELTAAYWIAHNVDEKILGFEHYRRYFVDKLGRPLTEKNMMAILEKYDAIVPQPRVFKNETVLGYYEKNHRGSDIQMLETVINDLYPEYAESFDKVFHGHSFLQYNMLVAKKKIFVDYHQWLFDILFELEKRVDISDLDAYQGRIFGFISERLLAVWLIKNAVNYTTRYVANIENSFIENAKDRYSNFVKGHLGFSNLHY